MKHATEVNAELNTAFDELRRLSGTREFERMVAWLDRLVERYRVHMDTCAPEDLPLAQVRLRQVLALYDALTLPGGAHTGFVGGGR